MIPIFCSSEQASAGEDVLVRSIASSALEKRILMRGKSLRMGSLWFRTHEGSEREKATEVLCSLAVEAALMKAC